MIQRPMIQPGTDARRGLREPEFHVNGPAMTRKAESTWMDIAADCGEFAIDAGWVIWMRSICMAQGGHRADAEFRLMVTEKIDAHSRFASKIIAGQVGGDAHSFIGGTLAHYAPKVRRNRRRLSRMR